MPFGLLTGLAAALAWGTLDVITALESRVIGSLRVAAGMLFVTAVEFAVLVVVTGHDAPARSAVDRHRALGLVGAGAYMAYFTGLQFGPIAVVSGTVAAFGGLTVVLRSFSGARRSRLLQAAGAAVATVGVLLTGIAFDGGIEATRFAGPGVVFALVAPRPLRADGDHVRHRARDDVAAPAVRRRSQRQHRRLVILLGRRRSPRTGIAARRRRADGRAIVVASRLVGALVVAGTLDVLGLMAFAIGLESAPTWMVGLAASFGPGGDDPRRSRLPRRAPEAGPMGRAGRDRTRDRAHRRSVTSPGRRSGRQAEPEPRLPVARTRPRPGRRRPRRAA